MSEHAITAYDVQKTYAGARSPALNGLGFEVLRGSVCGLLGPNGAGKTTAVRILATLLRLDAGNATVAGFDVRRRPAEVRRRIGLVGQHAAVDDVLSGRQNLVMFGRLNHLPTVDAHRRADELMERFGLADTGRKPVSAYSGGMRRRLDLAAGLLVTPEVLFVDEPTAALDPVARREVWAALRDLVAAGTTVLLTTQYLAEADELCDRVVMLRDGRVIAEGTPASLKSSIGGDRIDVVFRDGDQVTRARSVVERVASDAVTVDAAVCRIGMPVAEPTRALIDLTVGLAQQGIEPIEINLRRPTLDEVFIQLTREPARKSTVEVSA